MSIQKKTQIETNEIHIKPTSKPFEAAKTLKPLNKKKEEEEKRKILDNILHLRQQELDKKREQQTRDNFKIFLCFVPPPLTNYLTP